MSNTHVKNAADESQVKEVAKNAKSNRDQELADIRTVLSTDQGRRFVARLLSKFKIAGGVWTPSAEIHRNAGIQDCGQFILGEVVKADKSLGAKMLTEAYEKELRGD